MATAFDHNVVTPGTAEAGEAIVLDANKDATGVRNFTITGTSSAAIYSVGSSGTPATHTQGTPNIGMYVTASDTSGSSVEPLVFQTTMTGAGGTGGRALFKLVTNVALGGWANALKAYVDRQTNGRATGLMSVVVAEMLMPASTIGSGTSTIYEAEIVCPASFVASGEPWSVFYIAASGATVTEFDDHGCLFDISGVSSTSGGFWYDATNGTTDEWIKVKTPSGYRYLMLSDVQTEA